MLASLQDQLSSSHSHGASTSYTAAEPSAGRQPPIMCKSIPQHPQSLHLHGHATNAPPLQLTSQTSRTIHPLNRRRNLHVMPSLSAEKEKVFSQYGVPGLFSVPTYQETWLAYQNHLVDSVNALVRGTTDEDLKMKRLHEITSKQRSKAHLYNLSAQAHHNHFFFQSLSHQPSPDPPADTFQRQIEDWFESVEHLGEEMIDNALSMFGNGYVWLLAENDGKKTLRILCTYNAGSPYPEAHTRQQAMQPFSAASGGNNVADRLTRVTNQAGAFGNSTIAGTPQHFTGVLWGRLSCV